MIIGEHDVAGWFAPVPAFDVIGIHHDAVGEDNSLRDVMDVGHHLSVESLAQWELGDLRAVENVGVADPLEQIVSGVVRGTALVHRAGHGGLGQVVMIQWSVGFVEEIALRVSDLVIVGAAGPNEQFHAAEANVR